MATDSLFKVEYAKSARSKCQSCWSAIDKNTFRFAIMVQSRKFDGKVCDKKYDKKIKSKKWWFVEQVPRWYHMNCFFDKVKLSNIQLIRGFDDLRWDDQEKVHHFIEGQSTVASSESSTSNIFCIVRAATIRIISPKSFSAKMKNPVGRDHRTKVYLGWIEHESRLRTKSIWMKFVVEMCP